MASTFERHFMPIALILLSNEAGLFLHEFTTLMTGLSKEVILRECLTRWYASNPSTSTVDLYGSLLASGADEGLVAQFSFLLQVSSGHCLIAQKKTFCYM